ncbi:MAG: class I SAM-dependent methyltransferase, partial [Alphaproteobacteria bacterium]|nr:class I SAM-dependent methyltransferase [Alphaproteobacteria bacterium]
MQVGACPLHRGVPRRRHARTERAKEVPPTPRAEPPTATDPEINPQRQRRTSTIPGRRARSRTPLPTRACRPEQTRARTAEETRHRTRDMTITPRSERSRSYAKSQRAKDEAGHIAVLPKVGGGSDYDPDPRANDAQGVFASDAARARFACWFAHGSARTGYDRAAAYMSTTFGRRCACPGRHPSAIVAKLASPYQEMVRSLTPLHAFRLNVRNDCRICGKSDLIRILDLGCQPPSNSFIAPEDVAREQAFPLEMYLCLHCGLSQLRHVVAAEDIFNDYLYLSSTSGSLRRHYQGLIDGALAAFAPPEGALMVDIGCNDGIMLRRYPPGRYRLLGVEPSSAGDYARRDGFAVVHGFFTAELAARLVGGHGRAHIVTATNVFAHVDDIVSFAAGVRTLLADDGVYIVEFPYLRDMVKQCYFDTIYHEHLCYLALMPLVVLFERVGLKAFRVESAGSGASGPALRLFAARAESPRPVEDGVTAMLAAEDAWGLKRQETYASFARRVARVRGRVLALIDGLIAQGRTVGAFGAPAKGNTLLNTMGLGPDRIVAAAENNPLKIGKLTPGS